MENIIGDYYLCLGAFNNCIELYNNRAGFKINDDDSEETKKITNYENFTNPVKKESLVILRGNIADRYAVAKTINIPPIVGVPAFLRCASGTFSLIGCPFFCHARIAATNGRPNSSIIINATKKPPAN